MMPVPIHSRDPPSNYRAALVRGSSAGEAERELAMAWISLATRPDTAEATRRVLVLRPFVF